MQTRDAHARMLVISLLASSCVAVANPIGSRHLVETGRYPPGFVAESCRRAPRDAELLPTPLMKNLIWLAMGSSARPLPDVPLSMKYGR
jgi:hypothetical protein